MMETVRAKLILLLVSTMILIQSGPLPACLLDEAVAACFSPSTLSPSEHQQTVHAPKSNDTADEVNRAWSQQQTFGSDGSVNVLTHAVSGPILPTSHPAFDGPDSALDILRCNATSPSPPFDRPTRHFPLLT
jgi:hypothetical protein